MAIRLGRRRNDNEIGLTQNGARADCRLESRESRPAGGICSITRTPNRKCQNPLRMVEWWLCQRNLSIAAAPSASDGLTGMSAYTRITDSDASSGRGFRPGPLDGADPARRRVRLGGLRELHPTDVLLIPRVSIRRQYK